jgi:hypothetical protein
MTAEGRPSRRHRRPGDRRRVPAGSLPELNTALEFEVDRRGRDHQVLAEVAQQLGVAASARSA